MERLTRALGSDFYVNDNMLRQDQNGCTGDAINKLARFENVFEDLEAKQGMIAAQLERLREEDKIHTVKFKQLLAEKLTVSNILTLFRTYGL